MRQRDLAADALDAGARGFESIALGLNKLRVAK